MPRYSIARAQFRYREYSMIIDGINRLILASKDNYIQAAERGDFATCEAEKLKQETAWATLDHIRTRRDMLVREYGVEVQE